MMPDEVAALKPGPGDDVLVTRLADGNIVQVAERSIAPLVQHKVNALFAEGLPLVVLLCTGEFPSFEAHGLLLRPQELLNQVVASLGQGRRLGVFCPTAAHIPQVTRQWAAATGLAPLVRAASPYQGVEAVEPAAWEMKAAGVELAVLDCIAYTLAMQSKVREVTGAPTIVARGLTARVVKELLG
jgi:protein AroM